LVPLFETPLVSVGALGSGSPVGLGDAVGDVVGEVVGDAVGLAVGEAVGDAVGEAVGLAVGEAVGLGEAVPSLAAYRFLPSLWYATVAYAEVDCASVPLAAAHALMQPSA
jgi:hypothetical protein